VATRPIPEPIRSRVQHQGWIPLEFLGEDGGAIVYLCAKRELIQTIQDLMQQAGTAIREVQRDVEIACKMVQKLNVNLVAERNALSALIKTGKGVGNLFMSNLYEIKTPDPFSVPLGSSGGRFNIVMTNPSFGAQHHHRR